MGTEKNSAEERFTNQNFEKHLIEEQNTGIKNDNFNICICLKWPENTFYTFFRRKR